MEAAVEARTRELREDPDALAAYLLRAMPYIRAHDSADEGALPPSADRGDDDEEARGGGGGGGCGGWGGGGAGARGLARLVRCEAQDDESKRLEVLRRYLEDVEQVPRQPDPAPARVPRPRQGSEAVCKACGGARVVVDREAMMVCVDCGVTTSFLDQSCKTLTYTQLHEQFSPSGSFAYEPMNHFTEFLKQLQAKQDTEIPQRVLDLVAAGFRTARITRQRDMTPDKVRALLKQHDLAHMYDHRFKICQMLGGMPAPSFPEELETQLKHMFREVQAPWLKFKPPDRKNFLSYNYTLYKFCQLRGEDGYLQYFTLLKGRDKLRNQDVMWKKICDELAWQFIPTV